MISINVGFLRLCTFESFLFSGYLSYISNIPILNSAEVGLISTVHQEHVEKYHKPAFNIIGEIVNILNSSGKLPPCFASKKAYIARKSINFIELFSL